jgi:hypothetical protein
MKITKENLKKDLNNFCKNFKPTIIGEVWLKEDMMILNDVIKNKKLSKLDLEILDIFFLTRINYDLTNYKTVGGYIGKTKMTRLSNIFKSKTEKTKMKRIVSYISLVLKSYTARYEFSKVLERMNKLMDIADGVLN